jgi:hypothetical protein
MPYFIPVRVPPEFATFFGTNVLCLVEAAAHINRYAKNNKLLNHNDTVLTFDATLANLLGMPPGTQILAFRLLDLLLDTCFNSLLF